MTIAIKSSTDILRASITSAKDIGVKANQLREAQSNITNPAKYTSREELDKSGLSRKFDELQSKLLNIKSQDTALSINRSRLDNEKTSLEQVNRIITKFESELPQNNSVAGSKQEKVNSALSALESALRARDTSGKYVWGGKDSINNPLSVIDELGNRVNISLVNRSNIQHGLITNGYSISEPNKSLLTISSEHQVRESFLYPKHDAIAKTIGYLNMIKENADSVDAGLGNVYSDQELATAQKKQLDERGSLQFEINKEIKKTEQAFDINKRDAKEAMQENSDLFSANIVERSQMVRDLIVSLTALISISNVDAKVSDALFNLRV